MPRSTLWRGFEARVDDLLTTLELVEESGDAELSAELDRTVSGLERDFGRERTALLFSGEYDQRGAILSISAGAGGTEATDWAEMLVRMYLRWAERHRFKTEIVDRQEGEQAGIKSATVEVDGRFGLWLAAGRARRPSPRPDQPIRRPEAPSDHLRPRRGSARGRRRHRDRAELGRDPRRHVPLAGRRRPACQQDRLRRPPHPSADQHRRPEPERAKPDAEQGDGDPGPQVPTPGAGARGEREAELRKLKGEHVEAGWGNQIRSYVLHPYQMVKDLRTGHETGEHAGRPRRRSRRFHASGARAARDRRQRRGRRGGDRRRARHRNGVTTARRVRSGEARRSQPCPATGDAGRSDRVRPDLARILNDYLGRLAQEPIPDELGPILRLYDHLQATDPGTFIVAERAGRDGISVGSTPSRRSSRRGSLWFLSMLFILPRAQGRGLGRRLMESVGMNPGDANATRATATDSVQPISNALYASLGIVPRLPAVPARRSPRTGRGPPRDAGRHRRRRLRRDRRGGATESDRPRWPSSSTRWTVTSSASSDRPTTRSSPARVGAASCTAIGPAPRAATATRPRRAVSVPSSSPSRRCLALSSPTSFRRSSRVAHSASGCRARRTRRWSRCSDAGFRVDGFPTLLCWDRPFADWSRALPDLTGPAVATVAAFSERGVASRPMTLLSCPRTEQR